MVEAIVGVVGRIAKTHARFKPGRIFILRNNDIGDLLVITPMFDALKRLFPLAEIVVGIGRWNFPVMEGNPHVARLLPVNAPWHNKHSCTFPHNSARGLCVSMRYILGSPEAEALRRCDFDIGIDVLGSPEGALLLMKAGIPFRLGMRGYAGGHSAMQLCVPFNADEHVGRSALRYAELLGAINLPECRPQVFLSHDEQARGEAMWNARTTRRRRIVIGPGCGFAGKCWPRKHFVELTRRLAESPHVEIILVGGNDDRVAGADCSGSAANVKNRAGLISLRQTFAAVASADLVVCNSSMLMHAAAAFSKPAFVLLGEEFPSATQHARQWGYESNCWICGKAVGRDTVWSPEEVIQLMTSFLAGSANGCVFNTLSAIRGCQQSA